MADLVEVDTGQLAATAPNFSTVGADLLAAAERLQSGLAGLGAYYGEDKTGRQFGLPYEETRRAIVSALGTIAAGVCSAGGALHAIGANHEAADEASARSVADAGAGS